MGGENPYIEQTEAVLATSAFSIKFTSDGEELKTIQVDPSALPERGDGRPGSLLRLAHAAGVEIDHACGGVCACSTCHVVLDQGGFDTTNEASEDEEDMIDLAPGITGTSRLACQCVPDGTRDLVVEIPSWNRNAVQEGH
ncbi:MAG: 2Fe-2S iron-sulfur cluster binding domain-containing protein [Planctomycetes bacterium]|nr:2Fe-2S iron-sulfur cluster binding domain-containing protein [Planctomycetota bacterium]